MWFARRSRPRGAEALRALLFEVSRAELQVETCDRVLGVCEREHTDLESRVRRLEAELAELRAARVEAYSRWWETREARDRALHVARRLRRRLNRLRNRSASLERPTGREGAFSLPVRRGGERSRGRRQEI